MWKGLTTKKYIAVPLKQNPEGDSRQNVPISEDMNIRWRKKISTKALRKDMISV